MTLLNGFLYGMGFMFGLGIGFILLMSFIYGLVKLIELFIKAE